MPLLIEIGRHLRRFIPSILITGIGITTAILLLIFAMLLASADPVDFSLEGKQKLIKNANIIGITGIGYFATCLISAVLWIMNKQYVRHALLILAIIGIILIGLAVFSVGYFAPWVFMLMIPLVLSFIFIVKFVYERDPATT